MPNLNIGVWNCYEVFSKNKIFDPNSYPIGENLYYPAFILREKLSKLGMQINTLDMYPLEKFDLFIFFDIPDDYELLYNIFSLNKKMFLFINESEIIKPNNFDEYLHKYFERIFTWNDDMVDNEKYFKFFLPNKIPKEIIYAKKEKLCVMMCGNKTNNDVRELYSERLMAIKWFIQNNPNDFDLYGNGWDTEALTFYKGYVKEKINTLSKYKFAFCYENAKNIPGYITEKIFDSFFAGVIPIYLGAPNIKDFIPENVFIDRNAFADYNALYNYISLMSEERYYDYINNIKSFLKSDNCHKFSTEFWSDMLIEHITSLYNGDINYEKKHMIEDVKMNIFNKDIALFLKDNSGVKNFVEVDKSNNETAIWASQHFNVHIIEKSSALYGQFIKEQSDAKINYYYGDLNEKIRDLRDELKSPIILCFNFHLNYVGIYDEKNRHSLIKEIEIIINRYINEEIYIFINNERLPLNPPGLGTLNIDYLPTFQNILNLFTLDKTFKIFIYEDVIYIIPNKSKEKVINFIQHLNFVKEFIAFKNMQIEYKDNRFELINWDNRWPCLYDRTPASEFEPHYTYHPAWAARILAKINPKIHIDISSALFFSTIVSAFIPVKFYDYRPAKIDLEGLSSNYANITSLPFKDNSIESLSCMHVVEHIGLGRYGDPIDPYGDIKAIEELKRVLAYGGNFLFVVPIGKSKIQFNAHRIFSFSQIIDYFSDLKLIEFSLIPDNANKLGIIRNATKEQSDEQTHGCGCFWFTKNSSLE